MTSSVIDLSARQFESGMIGESEFDQAEDELLDLIAAAEPRIGLGGGEARQ